MSDYWTPERFAETDRLRDLATSVAPTLVGLSVEDAQARADEVGLSLRTAADDGAVTTAFASGRITAFARNGIIISADAG